MLTTLQKNTLVIWLLRLGIFGTFLGHGLYAISVKESWIHLITVYGFSNQFAVQVMPYIGVLDLFVAFSTLMYPMRPVLVWAAFWAFATALSRPIAGEPFLDFVERSSFWVAPLALLLLMKTQKKGLDL